jgi:uncharacterized protein (TIGR00290 family)
VIARAQIVLSWSGGKDSSLALDVLRRDPRYEVVALLTSVTRGYDRVSIHGVRRTLLERQAQRIGLPLYEVELSPETSNAAYEQAFQVAVSRLRADYPDVTQVAFGDLFLLDVREYRERLLGAMGCRALFPLWGRETADLAAEFIARGFEARLVCVDTHQLSIAYAGRRFDARLLSELPEQVDPCGERGEFHTFVFAGPIFTESIPIVLGEVVLRDERFGYCDLVEDPVRSGGGAAGDV